MKIILTALLCFSVLYSYCQATTEEEYNYMKKGYKQSIEMGLDLKKGYSIKQLKPYKDNTVTITFTLLKRTDGTLAGTILKTESSDAFGSGTNYYAIPAASSADAESYGWKNFYADLETMTNGMKTHILKYLSYAFAAMIAETKVK